MNGIGSSAAGPYGRDTLTKVLERRVRTEGRTSFSISVYCTELMLVGIWLLKEDQLSVDQRWRTFSSFILYRLTLMFCTATGALSISVIVSSGPTGVVVQYAFQAEEKPGMYKSGTNATFFICRAKYSAQCVFKTIGDG